MEVEIVSYQSFFFTIFREKNIKQARRQNEDRKEKYSWHSKTPQCETATQEYKTKKKRLVINGSNW